MNSSNHVPNKTEKLTTRHKFASSRPLFAWLVETPVAIGGTPVATRLVEAPTVVVLIESTPVGASDPFAKPLH